MVEMAKTSMTSLESGLDHYLWVDPVLDVVHFLAGYCCYGLLEKLAPRLGHDDP